MVLIGGGMGILMGDKSDRAVGQGAGRALSGRIIRVGVRVERDEMPWIKSTLGSGRGHGSVPFGGRWRGT